MFCTSGFIGLDGIREKPCAEHRESNSSLNMSNSQIMLFVAR